MADNEEEEDPGIATKLMLTAVVIVLAVPGLIIEPGPFSEIAAGGLLIAIWFGGGDAEDVASEATSASN